jgi:3-oxoacyl-(acyl-carrier-protein) synthase
MLSIELAIMMMRRQRFIGVPFFNQRQDRALRKILVNAVGFGGNAVSVLLSLP